MDKEEVEGIILVLSCQKHKETRMKKFKLRENKYENWRVIYVIGDLFLDGNYKLDENILTIKTEDSYIHLLKKLGLSLKYLNEIFDIKQGILRCGDDLVFNEANLIKFLNKENKPDYAGFSQTRKSLLEPKKEDLKIIRRDFLMVNYYLSHPEDFFNLQHNIKGINMDNYLTRPLIDIGAWGALYYISNYSCNLIINKMEEIKYNIFHYDNFTSSYPYIIEDCAVSFILYMNEVGFLHIDNFVAENNFSNFDKNIAVATNEYK